MSTRSAVTSSPVERLKLAHGFGIRPKVIFWIGRPVTVFMIVAMMLMECGYDRGAGTVQHHNPAITSRLMAHRGMAG